MRTRSFDGWTDHAEQGAAGIVLRNLSGTRLNIIYLRSSRTTVAPAEQEQTVVPSGFSFPSTSSLSNVHHLAPRRVGVDTYTWRGGGDAYSSTLSYFEV